MAINVRFLNNFVLTVVHTSEVDGKLTAQEKTFHIALGDVYPLSQYTRHPDGRLDLEFPDDCPLAGLAQNVESDYCELIEPKSRASAKITGCGGCGNKRR
jgi:hypothetical protein